MACDITIPSTFSDSHFLIRHFSPGGVSC